jgi:hypothetical protein
MMKKNHIILTVLFLHLTLSAFASEEINSDVLSWTSFRKIDGSKLICSDTVVIRINKRQGETACNFALQYSKNDKLTIENATIEDISGRVVRKLKNSEILTRNSISDASTLYQDEFIKEFNLKHNIYPYRIKLCYTMVFKDFFLIDDWRPIENVWQNHDVLGQSVQAATLTVDIPADYEIRYKFENIDEPQIEHQKDRKIFRWRTSYKGQQRENYAPYSALKIPRVIINPLHFKYGVAGSWLSWETFGDWVRRLNDKTQTLSAAEKSKVAQMLDGIESEREKIKILYRYLQTTTRYINVKIGTGGFRSYPANYVATNKYGDCKALSTYMLALLECAGISAYYTLIQAGDRIEKINKDFPAQVFNHAIVTVPLKDDTLFLECTNKNIPCGYMGTFTQNREALIISDTPHFVHIPALDESEALSSTKFEANPADLFTSVRLDIVARGYLYDRYSNIFNNLNNTTIERYLRYVLAGKWQMLDYKIEDADRSQPQIRLSVQMKMSDILKQYGDDVLIGQFSRALPDFEKPAERTQKVQIDYPLCYADTNVYLIPPGMKWQLMSKSGNVESRFGTYQYNYRLDDKKLLVIKKFSLFTGEINPDEYAGFYEFIEKVKKNEEQSIHLIQKTAL